MSERGAETDDASPSVEDYLRATAKALGLNPDAAVAHLDQTLAHNREARRRVEAAPTSDEPAPTQDRGTGEEGQ